MKKVIALITAIIVAALSICTLTVCAFADEAGTETLTAVVDVDATRPDPEEKTTALEIEDPRQPTKPAPTTTTEKVEDETVVTTPDSSEKETTTEKVAPTHGTDVTYFDDGTTKPATKPATKPVATTKKPVATTKKPVAAPSTTKKAPAEVEEIIPDTGSKVVVPAIALVALAGSVAVVIKTKKD